MAADYLNRQEDLLEPVSIVDDYTGQNNFHILIANGTDCGGLAAAEMLFSIVTFEPFRQRLLRGRATGRFFCPYYGTVHLGTTPLHFAVLSQQISFVKLILERLCKSDIERLDVLWDQDNSGNMVLHLAVMADNIEIYDYIRHSFLYLEALLTKGKTVDGRILKSIQTDSNIKNRLNFTPLELAAALGKREMLNHMINSDVVTIWEYNVFSLKGYAMRDIDTFKTLALDRWQLAQTVRQRSCIQSDFYCIIDHASYATVQATVEMRRRERSNLNAGVGVVWNFAQKWLYGSLASLVSRSYFESNVLEIILDRQLIELCSIPGIIYTTNQKWEVCPPHFCVFCACAH